MSQEGEPENVYEMTRTLSSVIVTGVGDAEYQKLFASATQDHYSPPHNGSIAEFGHAVTALDLEHTDGIIIVLPADLTKISEAEIVAIKKLDEDDDMRDKVRFVVSDKEIFTTDLLFSMKHWGQSSRDHLNEFLGDLHDDRLLFKFSDF
ncbi:hypothetical protein KBC31_03560 [Candidatus Saccharibacteria bacterium]|jgi:hypothetical protein|nr:hypothetical protein [Candidatus Saccharibacteria bacterium]